MIFGTALLLWLYSQFSLARCCDKDLQNVAKAANNQNPGYVGKPGPARTPFGPAPPPVTSYPSLRGPLQHSASFRRVGGDNGLGSADEYTERSGATFGRQSAPRIMSMGVNNDPYTDQLNRRMSMPAVTPPTGRTTSGMYRTPYSVGRIPSRRFSFDDQRYGGQEIDRPWQPPQGVSGGTSPWSSATTGRGSDSWNSPAPDSQGVTRPLQLGGPPTYASNAKMGSGLYGGTLTHDSLASGGINLKDGTNDDDMWEATKLLSSGNTYPRTGFGSNASPLRSSSFAMSGPLGQVPPKRQTYTGAEGYTPNPPRITFNERDNYTPNPSITSEPFGGTPTGDRRSQAGRVADEDLWKEFDSLSRTQRDTDKGYGQTVPQSSSLDRFGSINYVPKPQTQQGIQPIMQPKMEATSNTFTRYDSSRRPDAELIDYTRPTNKLASQPINQAGFDGRRGDSGGMYGFPASTGNAGMPPPANAELVTRLPSPVTIANQADPEGENPDKWVPHNAKLDTLPESVILPLIYEYGAFYAYMTVGTARQGEQEQKLKVLFDTGSSHIWLLTTESCYYEPCYDGAHQFNPWASASYEKVDYTFQTQYTTGKVSGKFGKDTVSLGDPPARIVVKKQMIGEAEKRKDVLDRYDVLCGMSLVAPRVMSNEPYSFLYTMTKQYGTTLPFGFFIDKYDLSQSKLIFGEGYQDYIVGDLNTHNVHKVPYRNYGKFYDGWYVKFDGWFVETPGKEPVYLRVDREIFALVDTGASSQSGPEKMMTDLNKAIFEFASFKEYNNDFTLPCDMDTREVFKQLPDVSAVIDGIKYPLPPWDYIMNQVGTCRPAFVYTGQDDHVVLGRQFMSTYFTRFNHSKKTVQFGLSKQDLQHKSAKYHLWLAKMRWPNRN